MGPARQLHPADVERPMKSSLDWSNFNNYQQTTKSKSEAVQEQEKISLFRSIVGSGIYLRQERYMKCSTYSERIGFKNVKSYSYVICSLEEVSRILEEDYGLLSGT